ncbi:MAG: MFS transporter [Bacteroidota bacterium]
MYQFNIVFGILIAFLSNYFLQGAGGDNDWRWMLGVLVVPSVIYTLMVLGVPESPRWLITKRNDLSAAKKVLSEIGVADVDTEVSSIIASNQHETLTGNTSGFFSSKHKTIIWLAFMIAIFLTSFPVSISFFIMPRNTFSERFGSKRIFVEFHCYWRVPTWSLHSSVFILLTGWDEKHYLSLVHWVISSALPW